MRQFDGNTYRGLKAVTRRLINSFGKQEVAAMETRVNHVMLSNYASLNPDHEGCFMPADVLADLTHASGNTEVLEYLASLQGKILVDEPEGRDCNLEAKSLQVVKGMADSISSIMEAMENGKIDAHERPALIEELKTLQSQAADLLTGLSAAR
ncbi:MAG: hypothetical protein N4A65_00445 [Cohaesibacter sp.]|jgi:hypothetical protein|nr:hypothetical protein [Cohaesibacter sp.]